MAPGSMPAPGILAFAIARIESLDAVWLFPQSDRYMRISVACTLPA
eukprot:CAMPEP_0176141288 /NCGR_PEP_ID=MMETSP0120_2-20121206/71841_1 /TAXON_ID=160619 /ORGANISM="Kryptoperidinium foliaceum, Strain CCMP 1326" /LENGTH=45 /DNA_ID= /DNA_START= /DNA_END= /DNA_ORIENTATION=